MRIKLSRLFDKWNRFKNRQLPTPVAILIYGVGIVSISIPFTMTAGCNKQIFDTSFTFNKAIVTYGNETVEYKIDSWRDFTDGDQIQFTTKDGKTYLCHSSNCVLVSE